METSLAEILGDGGRAHLPVWLALTGLPAPAPAPGSLWPGCVPKPERQDLQRNPTENAICVAGAKGFLFLGASVGLRFRFWLSELYKNTRAPHGCRHHAQDRLKFLSDEFGVVEIY